MPDSVRIDKWLWAARFFKTRSLAAKECAAGKIKRSGTPLKPSTMIRVGLPLEIPAPDGTHKRLIEVIALLDKRVSAPLAREAYLDHTPPEVLAAAQEKRAALQEERLRRQEGDQGRMTKKKRREWNAKLHRFTEDP